MEIVGLIFLLLIAFVILGILGWICKGLEVIFEFLFDGCMNSLGCLVMIGVFILIIISLIIV